MKLRFEQFNDSELYILKRALIEAIPRMSMNYTLDELDIFDNLLAEAIDNIKARERVGKDISRTNNSRIQNTSSNEEFSKGENI